MSKPPRKRPLKGSDGKTLWERMQASFDNLQHIPPSQPEGRPVVATSSRRARGKVRGNKRNPRTHVVAITDCKVYASQEDYDNGNGYTVERASTRDAAKRKLLKKQREREVAAKVAARLASEGKLATKSITIRDAGALFNS